MEVKFLNIKSEIRQSSQWLRGSTLLTIVLTSVMLSGCTIPEARPTIPRTFCTYKIDPPVAAFCNAAMTEKEVEELSCEVEEGHYYAAVCLGHKYLIGNKVPRDMFTAYKWYKIAADKGISVAQVQMGHFYRDGCGCAVPQDSKKAIEWYTRAANQGDIAGMIALGEMYRGWHGTIPDHAKAIQWYERGAARGSSEAELQLAILLTHRSKNSYGPNKSRAIHVTRTTRDIPNTSITTPYTNEGFKRLIALAEECHPDAMAALGDVYYEGRMGPRDTARAFDYWCRSARLGSGLGAFKLGMAYSLGECVPRNYENAVKWLLEAAEMGYPEAEMHLGNLYRDGVGVPRSYKTAARWYMRAVNHGYVAANVELGDLYHSGKGVPRYLEEAVRYYTVAAESGDAYAALMLSIMYEDARGVQHDFCKSVSYYDFASAQAGFRLALYKVGRRFAAGFGLPRNMHDAIKWYCRAAECGLSMAQVELGDLYYSGECLTQDFGKAFEWYHKAAVQGHTYAQNMLGLILLEGDCLPKYAKTPIPCFVPGGNICATCCKQCNQFPCVCEPAYSEKPGNACPVCELLCEQPCLKVNCHCDPCGACNCGRRYAYLACNQKCCSRFSFCCPTAGRCTVAISPENARRAAIWIRKAALSGAGQAQFQLGILYMTGIGVPKDDSRAYAWLRTGLECMEDKNPDVLNCLIHRMCPEDKPPAVMIAEHFRKHFKCCPQLPQRY